MNFYERWKDIRGYEGLYQVSNYGRVRSLERRVNWKNTTRLIKEKILNPLVSNNRLYARLCNGVQIDFEIHRLVAEAFIPNPNGYDVVHHIDHNPHNNRVENLRWMNKGEHTAMHTIENLSKKVYQYTLDGKLVKIWKSTNECGRNGFNQARVSLCCLGKGKTHKGFKWNYKYE